MTYMSSASEESLAEALRMRATATENTEGYWPTPTHSRMNEGSIHGVCKLSFRYFATKQVKHLFLMPAMAEICRQKCGSQLWRFPPLTGPRATVPVHRNWVWLLVTKCHALVIPVTLGMVYAGFKWWDYLFVCHQGGEVKHVAKVQGLLRICSYMPLGCWHVGSKWIDKVAQNGVVFEALIISWRLLWNLECLDPGTPKRLKMYSQVSKYHCSFTDFWSAGCCPISYWNVSNASGLVSCHFVQIPWFLLFVGDKN